MSKYFIYGAGFSEKGRYYSHYLKGNAFLGKGYIEGYHKYILGGIDGIIPEEGEPVQGDVYELDQKAISKLDFLFNYDTKFRKEVVDVKLENGETLQAEAYVWNGSVSK
ncbi:MAG: gamma-glutamylcyclotransferase family protein [Syntrophomonadaceae bacterium]